MIAFPNSKINLGLNVVEKRTDGFHNIETVFYPIGLNDVLEIAASKETLFISTGLEIPGDAESNLCLKAYQLLRNEFQLPNVKIHLHKVIPMGAGLGGGSSDAAFTLKLLNRYFDLKLTDEQLMKYAASLGADCAFFIKNKVVSASEKGDCFRNLSFSLMGYQIVVVIPKVHVETAKAYSKIKPKETLKTPSEILMESKIQDWKSILVNDFEEPIFDLYPELSLIKSELYKQGAIYAAMSGSGSALFGLFNKPVGLSEHFKDDFYWSSLL